MEATTTLREELAARRDLPPPAERRALREAAGISLETVAREIGVTRQAVGHWEAGDRRPRGANLRRYVEVLRILAGASP
jgi:transcriptional regulator with XRE-family HTH domain